MFANNNAVTTVWKVVDDYVFRQLYICMFFNRKERKDLRKVHKDFLLQIIGIIPNFTIYDLFVFYLLSSFLQLTTFSTHNPFYTISALNPASNNCKHWGVNSLIGPVFTVHFPL